MTLFSMFALNKMDSRFYVRAGSSFWQSVRCRVLLRTFYDTVEASAVFYTIMCLGEAAQTGQRRALTSWFRELASHQTVYEVS